MQLYIKKLFGFSARACEVHTFICVSTEFDGLIVVKI